MAQNNLTSLDSLLPHLGLGWYEFIRSPMNAIAHATLTATLEKTGMIMPLGQKRVVKPEQFRKPPGAVLRARLCLERTRRRGREPLRQRRGQPGPRTRLLRGVCPPHPVRSVWGRPQASGAPLALAHSKSQAAWWQWSPCPLSHRRTLTQRVQATSTLGSGPAAAEERL